MDKKKLELKFQEIHNNDKEQIDLILSNEKRIIVSSPAGCGKTKTMISKIAYEIITNKNLNNKRILALTFSINAATKIREDTKEELPIIFKNYNFDVNKILNVFNYHSFANKLLKKHGYFISDNLKYIDDFLKLPDDDNQELVKYLTENEKNYLLKYDKALKNLQFQDVDMLEEKYLEILLKKLVPNKIITFNGMLLVAIKLLDIQSIKRFYNSYYHMMIVDEFQDTNYLSFKFLDKLMQINKVILMGDDLQKIYGFLGAVPNLIDIMKKKYNMTSIEFKTNHRFKNNFNMMKFDKYIRGIFVNYDNINEYEESANVKFKFAKSDYVEINFIINDILKRIKNNNNVAILFRAKYLANDIIKMLDKNDISYFYGLFDDTDSEYVEFHKKALLLFINESGVRKSFRKTVKENVLIKMRNYKSSICTDSIKFNSLMRLLEGLLDKVGTLRISNEEKYEKIIYILNNNSLKRLMNEIDEKVTLTTIHGSKGLEWDYVYIPKMTAFSFPSSKALCKECSNNDGGNTYEKYCEFKFKKKFERKFCEELSIFYVAITRAKKDVILSANTGKNEYGYHKRISCILFLPNLNVITDF